MRTRTIPAFDFDRQDALVPFDPGTEALGEPQLGVDASFGPDEAGARLVIRGLVTVEPELGKAGGHLRRVEALVGNSVVVRAGDRRRQEIVAMVAGRAAAGCLDDETAALREEILAGLGLELAPDGVRAAHQRRVLHPLPDRLAGDAGVPVCRPVDMRR